MSTPCNCITMSYHGCPKQTLIFEIQWQLATLHCPRATNKMQNHTLRPCDIETTMSNIKLIYSSPPALWPKPEIECRTQMHHLSNSKIKPQKPERPECCRERTTHPSGNHPDTATSPKHNRPHWNRMCLYNLQNPRTHLWPKFP